MVSCQKGPGIGIEVGRTLSVESDHIIERSNVFVYNVISDVRDFLCETMGAEVLVDRSLSRKLNTATYSLLRVSTKRINYLLLRRQSMAQKGRYADSYLLVRMFTPSLV